MSDELSTTVSVSPLDAATAVFHMQKSNFFRVVHCDGVWCSETPSHRVQLMFYSERLPIPQQTFYHLNEDKSLGDEQVTRRVIKQGYIREVEVSTVMDIGTLKALHVWLGEYLKKIEPIATDETKL